MALITRSQQPIIAPPTNALPVKAWLLPALCCSQPNATLHIHHPSRTSNTRLAKCTAGYPPM